MSEYDELENLDDLDDDVGLDEEDKKHAKNPNQLEWFRGDKGTTYRVSVLYYHPVTLTAVKQLRKIAKKEGKALTRDAEIEYAKKKAEEHAQKLGKSYDQLEPWQKLDLNHIQFKKVEAHYKENFGYAVSRLGKDGPEADSVWRQLGDVKKYFTTILLIYPTNREGELDKDRFKNGAFKIQPWRLSSKTYGQLHQASSSLRANKLNVATQDLEITCTNADFQNFDKMSAGGPAIWRKSEAFQEKILKSAMELYDKLQPFRVLSTADLRIKLGLDSGSGGEDVSEEDMEDLFNNV